MSGHNWRVVKSWLLLAAFIVAILIKRRLAPDPLVELDRAAEW